MTEKSILIDIKKLLGLPEDDEDFNQDIIIFINSSFSKLNQLGVGPSDGFSISGVEETWDDFKSDIRYSDVKTFIYLDVKLVFDPPSVGIVNSALKDQLKEITWRIRERREEDRILSMMEKTYTRRWIDVL